MRAPFFNHIPGPHLFFLDETVEGDHHRPSNGALQNRIGGYIVVTGFHVEESDHPHNGDCQHFSTQVARTEKLDQLRFQRNPTP